MHFLPPERWPLCGSVSGTWSECVLDFSDEVGRKAAVLRVLIYNLGAIGLMDAIKLVSRRIGLVSDIWNAKVGDDAIGFS